MHHRRFYWNLCLLIGAVLAILTVVLTSEPVRRLCRPAWTQWRAERGNPQAQLKLAAMYAKGTGVPRDDKESLR